MVIVSRSTHLGPAGCGHAHTIANRAFRPKSGRDLVPGSRNPNRRVKPIAVFFGRQRPFKKRHGSHTLRDECLQSGHNWRGWHRIGRQHGHDFIPPTELESSSSTELHLEGQTPEDPSGFGHWRPSTGSFPLVDPGIHNLCPT